MQTAVATYKHTNPTLFYGGAFCGGVDPRREQYAGEDVAGEGFCCGDNNLKTKSIADDSPNYEKLQYYYHSDHLGSASYITNLDGEVVQHIEYVPFGEGFCCEPKANTRKGRSLPTENVDYERLQYYYHSDHLGSASYITNLDGEVVQHIEYVPFGEVLLEERNNTWNTPFLFNGKELDEETGLYYYGARYYNPRISLWYGVDPLAEKYPAHSPYCYTMNNPVMLIDPDGKRVWLAFFDVGAKAGLGGNVGYTSRSGMARDDKGITRFEMKMVQVFNNDLREGSQTPEPFAGIDIDLFSVGLYYDSKSSTLKEHIGKHSPLTISGYVVDLSISNDGFGLEGGLSAGISLGMSNVDEIQSLSYSNEEAAFFDKYYGAGQFSVENANDVKDGNGKTIGYTGTLHFNKSNGEVIKTGISVKSEALPNRNSRMWETYLYRNQDEGE